MSNPNPSPSTRMQPGETLNPGGRTPSKWLREYLDAAYDKTAGGRTRRLTIADRLMTIAMSDTLTKEGINYKDSMDAIRLLTAYDMGKPVEAVELSGAGGSPLSPAVGIVDAVLAAALEKLGKTDALPADK
ncbi:MAG TPA: hypothetical protein VJ801_06445 [Polyangia bacterium]|nr:hypothetical protein [Polyangia bacterium]